MVRWPINATSSKNMLIEPIIHKAPPLCHPYRFYIKVIISLATSRVYPLISETIPNIQPIFRRLAWIRSTATVAMIRPHRIFRCGGSYHRRLFRLIPNDPRVQHLQRMTNVVSGKGTPSLHRQTASKHTAMIQNDIDDTRAAFKSGVCCESAAKRLGNWKLLVVFFSG